MSGLLLQHASCLFKTLFIKKLDDKEYKLFA